MWRNNDLIYMEKKNFITKFKIGQRVRYIGKTDIVKFLNKSDFFSDWKMVLINVFVIICALHILSCYFIFLGLMILNFFVFLISVV